jgi:hypothetical protein
MGRIVLNHRESRITVVDGLILPPAEVPHVGATPIPSKTKFTSAQMALVNKCPHTQHLFGVPGYLELGEEVPDEDAPAPAPAALAEKKK